MDRYEAHMQRLLDVTRESNFALWNALLTLNGIVASVFSAVAVFEEKTKPIAFFIVLLSMLSALPHSELPEHKRHLPYYRPVGS